MLISNAEGWDAFLLAATCLDIWSAAWEKEAKIFCLAESVVLNLEFIWLPKSDILLAIIVVPLGSFNFTVNVPSSFAVTVAANVALAPVCAATVPEVIE